MPTSSSSGYICSYDSSGGAYPNGYCVWQYDRYGHPVLLSCHCKTGYTCQSPNGGYAYANQTVRTPCIPGSHPNSTAYGVTPSVFKTWTRDKQNRPITVLRRTTRGTTTSDIADLKKAVDAQGELIRDLKDSLNLKDQKIRKLLEENSRLRSSH